MSYLTMTPHQVALMTLLPKPPRGVTAEALATASTFPFRMVVEQLKPLVLTGAIAFDEATGEYHKVEGDR